MGRVFGVLCRLLYPQVRKRGGQRRRQDRTDAGRGVLINDKREEKGGRSTNQQNNIEVSTEFLKLSRTIACFDG